MSPTPILLSDIQYMREALRLASIRRGFCAPNPSVGAVIVKEGKIIARGLHWASGCAHAEVDALHKLQAGEAQGATLYVTLEPCCHFGKTPPCTQAIINSGITRLVYGFRDPNPIVSGKGEQILLEAGIMCEYLELSKINTYYQSYNYWQKTQRPWVTAKLAVSLDGKIAQENGRPAVITGPELEKYTHTCRKHSDAILTTAKTICCDDPALNVRLEEETLAKPVYILDRLLAIPLGARIFNTASKITLFHQAGLDTTEFNKLGAHCVPMVNLSEILLHIGTEGVQDLWVEAGGQCFQSLCEQGFAQRALLYLGASWLGKKAQSAFAENFDVFTRAQAIHWQMFGRDALCELDL